MEDFDENSSRSILAEHLGVSIVNVTLTTQYFDNTTGFNVDVDIAFSDTTTSNHAFTIVQVLSNNLDAFSSVVGLTVESATDPVVSRVTAPGGVTAMTITGGGASDTGNIGDVGIGTTSPTEKLDVAGNVSVALPLLVSHCLILNHQWP